MPRPSASKKTAAIFANYEASRSKEYVSLWISIKLLFGEQKQNYVCAALGFDSKDILCCYVTKNTSASLQTTLKYVIIL